MIRWVYVVLIKGRTVLGESHKFERNPMVLGWVRALHACASRKSKDLSFVGQIDKEHQWYQNVLLNRERLYCLPNQTEKATKRRKTTT